MKDIKQKAEDVSKFLKSLASPKRLQILCALADGEKSVTELIAATGIAQTSMSQHLARLKADKIAMYRREHRTLYYSICHDAVGDIMNVLTTHFCKEE